MFRGFDPFVDHVRARRTAAKRVALVIPFAVVSYSAAEVVSVSLSPTTIAAGTNSTATVSTKGTTIGFTGVSLSSSNTAVATVPSNVQVESKTNTATFTVRGVSGSAGCSTISARVGVGGVPKTATVFVTPPAPTGSLRVSVPANGTVGGTTANGSLMWIGVPPAGGISVQLSSSSPNATVPATVTIPPSAVNETGVAVVQFPIQTTTVAPTKCAVITGTSGANSARALLKIVTISG